MVSLAPKGGMEPKNGMANGAKDEDVFAGLPWLARAFDFVLQEETHISRRKCFKRLPGFSSKEAFAATELPGTLGTFEVLLGEVLGPSCHLRTGHAAVQLVARAEANAEPEA